jgi:hypothetical protein
MADEETNEVNGEVNKSAPMDELESVSVVGFEIDLPRFFSHLDIDTASILEALARAVETDGLDHSDIIANMIRNTAANIKEIDDSVSNEEIDFTDEDNEEEPE